MLLVDLGNSRIKWATLGSHGPTRMHAAAHHGWRSEDFRRALFPGRSGARAAAATWRGTRVLAVSVASPAVQRRFVAAVRLVTGAGPHFVRSQSAAAGIRNGYRDAWRLGADRWVALIGARHCLPETALCVADIGTATTVDLLAADGRHRGGVILPGPQLMIDALLRDTGGIRRRMGRMRRRIGPFARDTAAAVYGGALYATASAIDRLVREACLAVDCTEVSLLLTGGGAPAVAPRLETRHRLLPDLVLRGLAVLARAQRDA